jgi:indolepyruvate ferredoxin oxidoreductase
VAAGSLDHRYLLESGLVHLTGVQALARLPLDLLRADRRAGRATAGFISGYEGSPLGGYDLELSRNQRLLDAYGVVFKPGVNEELAATAVQGSQLASASPGKTVDGVIGIWYGKSPGLDRATDALRHSNLMGTHARGGALALVGDDPAAKSSTVPGASELLLADLGMPTLYPADPQEALDFGLHAVAMSRASGLWVAMKIATNVADGSGTVQVHPDRVVPVVPEHAVAHQVTATMLQPMLGELELSRDGTRLAAAREYAALNGLNRVVRGGPDDRVGIVAAGKTFLDLRQALSILGFDDAELARRGVRLLHLGMIHPLEPSVVTGFAAGLAEIVVVEEKRSFIESALKDLLYGRAAAPAVSGKRHPDGTPLLPPGGELDPDTIAAALAARLTAIGGFGPVDSWRPPGPASPPGAAGPPRQHTELPLLPRTPYFCSGCPHNSSTKVPAGSLVGAGIGCHAIVALMDPGSVGTVTGLTQMGGEGAQWIGMEPFVGQRHLLQNLGDGTFHHSGSLAIRAAVAAGATITYKLLYNSAVAMTGGQQPAGRMAVPELVRELVAEGVQRVIVTTGRPRRYRRAGLPRGVQVWHRDRLIEAQETLARLPGVTVLVHDQECATELRRKRKRGLAPDPAMRVMINERVCEGCGDCGRKSNCLSVQPVATEFGRKTQIDQSSCNKDYSCLDGDCPSFLTVLPGRGKARRQLAPPMEPGGLPEAAPAAAHGSHTTRITGIGGSGVVTLSQVLSMAATMAGRHVRALDQTGLAQKGGAVVSDIKITDGPQEQANKASAGECDLYLGCDLLVAADARYLAAADPGRTVAVVSIAEVPTGKMVIDTGTSFPGTAQTVGRIREATRAQDAVFLNARELAEALLGDDQFANMLLTGAAYQAGALPVPADAIEEAIALNGVKVEANVQAFRRGRQAVASPADLAAAVAAVRGTPAAGPAVTDDARALAGIVRARPGSELARLAAIRVADLMAYQDAAYARTYAQTVEKVRRAEAGQTGHSTELAETVARSLHKLMAYKDEYEVARLSLDPAAETAVRARFGAGAKISYRLHPPVLRAAGLRRKLRLGPWFKPVLRVLAAMRRLRGTRFDVFGYTAVRRAERELIAEYRQVIEQLATLLRPGNHALAVEIAALPDLVRGYEDVKLAAVARYRERLGELTGKLVEQATASHT